MRWLDRLEEWIVISMLAAMTGLTFLQVVLRYVFNSGFTWALEMTTIFFAVMIFVGISYGVRVGAHIGVDALVKLMPSPVRGAACPLWRAGLPGLRRHHHQWLAGLRAEDEVGRHRTGRPADSDVDRARRDAAGLCAAHLALSCRCCWNLITGKSDSLHLADEAAEALKLKAEEGTA
jgi:C4-dicarboxylate transporter DctQ subunit